MDGTAGNTRTNGHQEVAISSLEIFPMANGPRWTKTKLLPKDNSEPFASKHPTLVTACFLLSFKHVNNPERLPWANTTPRYTLRQRFSIALMSPLTCPNFHYSSVYSSTNPAVFTSIQRRTYCNSGHISSSISMNFLQLGNRVYKRCKRHSAPCHPYGWSCMWHTQP